MGGGEEASCINPGLGVVGSVGTGRGTYSEGGWGLAAGVLMARRVRCGAAPSSRPDAARMQNAENGFVSAAQPPTL